MTEPSMDFSKETLTRICKGDISKLPTFVVHRNRTWRKDVIRLDKKNRIHMSVRSFLRSVKSQVPVRAGLWLNKDAQAFYINLQPHHIGGGADTVNRTHNYKHSREIAGADEHGRFEDDQGHGETVPDTQRVDPVDLDAARAENQRTGGGVKRDWLGGGNTEDG